MESRPNYVLVGLFLLLSIAMAVGAVLWVYGYRGKQEFVECVIMTEESVKGLKVGSPVRYKGVDVGKVEDIHIDPTNPDVVVIFLKVRKGVPIRSDTTATVLPLGITGLSYVSLSGGKGGKPYMVKINGKAYPIVAYKISQIEKLSRSLPEILAHVDELVVRLNRTFSDKNIKNITITTERLARLTEELERLIAKGEGTLEQINGTSLKAAAAFERLSFLADSMRNATERFDRKTLPKLEELTLRLNRAVKLLRKLLEEIESDPSVIIYGPRGEKR